MVHRTSRKRPLLELWAKVILNLLITFLAACSFSFLASQDMELDREVIEHQKLLVWFI